MALVKAQVGQTVRVLVEGYGRNEGTLSGRLDNNLTVEFEADSASWAAMRWCASPAPVPPSCWVNFRNNIDILDTLS